MEIKRTPVADRRSPLDLAVSHPPMTPARRLARGTLLALTPFLLYIAFGVVINERKKSHELHPRDFVTLVSANRRMLNYAQEIPWSPPDVIPTTNVPSDIPRLVRTEWYTQGPISQANILESAPPSVQNGDCLSIGETLLTIGATKYYQLLQDAGLRTVILDPKDVQATLLVPVDEAFFYEIDATPLREERSIDELIYYAPELKKPLAGATILEGLWASDSFGSGMRIPTSNYLGMNQLFAVVEELDEVDEDNRRKKGIAAENGNTVELEALDIVTCGPSIIHVVSDVVLPFGFDDEPIDVTDLV